MQSTGQCVAMSEHSVKTGMLLSLHKLLVFFQFSEQDYKIYDYAKTLFHLFPPLLLNLLTWTSILAFSVSNSI